MKVEGYERQAIELLCADEIPNSVLHAAIVCPENISCKFTGAGYYLEIRHRELPSGRVVCDKPLVRGIYQEQEVGFVVFIEDNTICLECYGYGHHGIPEGIRNGTVQISVT